MKNKYSDYDRRYRVYVCKMNARLFISSRISDILYVILGIPKYSAAIMIFAAAVLFIEPRSIISTSVCVSVFALGVAAQSYKREIAEGVQRWAIRDFARLKRYRDELNRFEVERQRLEAEEPNDTP